jgi:hypothetical protein
MMYKFECNWGSGEPGTVATEYMTLGPNQRPKGIPRLSLLASLVDPRLKVAAGIAEADVNFMWDALLEEMVLIATLEEDSLATAALDDDANANNSIFLLKNW